MTVTVNRSQVSKQADVNKANATLGVIAAVRTAAMTRALTSS